MEGSAESCRRALAPAANITLAAPSGTRQIAATARVGAIAVIPASTPKPPAESASDLPVTLRREPV